MVGEGRGVCIYGEGEAWTVVSTRPVKNLDMLGKGRHDNVLDAVACNVKDNGRGVDRRVDFGRPVLEHPVAVQGAECREERREGE